MAKTCMSPRFGQLSLILLVGSFIKFSIFAYFWIFSPIFNILVSPVRGGKSVVGGNFRDLKNSG